MENEEIFFIFCEEVDSETATVMYVWWLVAIDIVRKKKRQ